jgi:glycosyltransferase involved in cell wall biosynthesis
MKFKIVVPYYNSEWIVKCLKSIQEQTFENYQVLVIDDCSEINNFDEVENIFKDDKRFTLTKNENRLYALNNIYHGTKKLFENDEDVTMVIDGDDWLTSKNSLQTVYDTYKRTDCVLTHGSWISYPDNQTNSLMCSKYSEKVIKNRDYRFTDWKCTHLKTYKYKLFNQIKLLDLIDKRTNDFYRVTCDLALMFPMLEMAGNKIEFIEDKIYTYNTDNPINDHKVHRKEQLEIEHILRNKKKYDKIF